MNPHAVFDAALPEEGSGRAMDEVIRTGRQAVIAAGELDAGRSTLEVQPVK